MFYGWLIVGLAMLSALLGAGLNNVSMAVMLRPISEDLGWGRTLTSGAITAGALFAGVLAPGIGRLADRFGPRALMPLGAAVGGCLALLLSQVHEPWQFYSVYIPGRAIGDTLLAGVVGLTAVANWFQVRRPRAIGLVAMSVPLGSAAMALLYQTLLTHFGWRAAFVALAVVLWTLGVLPAAVFLRRQPEDLGLVPDGKLPVASGGAVRPDDVPPTAAQEYSWQLREAMGTPALWLIVVSALLATVATGGIAFHVVAYYTDVGVRADLAAGALGVLALAGAAGSATWATLSERVPPRYVAVGVQLLSAGTVLLLLQVQAPLLAYAVALLFGLVGRGGLVVTPVLIGRYYGRRSFGAISGFADPFGKVGLGCGPLAAGAAFDLTGSYVTVFGLFCAAYVLAAGLIWFASRPTPRVAAG